MPEKLYLLLRWLWLGPLAVAVGIALTGSTAAAQETIVRLETPAEEVRLEGPPFTVSVVVDDVVNLGAFQLEMVFDSSILRFVEVAEGPFLGSSGRTVQCLPPVAAEGLVRFVCVTLGETPEGPEGSGVLATITFEPLSAGSSDLQFQKLILADPPGEPIFADYQDASIAVVPAGDGGLRWVLWGPVIGGVVLVVSAAAASFWWFRLRPPAAGSAATSQ
ncbi:MAG: cohesin domain-containing protein [Dehalococcoidia bacterium]